jgi:hypothetical protein
VVALAWLGGSGCSSTTPGSGIDGGAQDGAVAEAGGFGASACGQCVATACQGAIRTCGADPDCTTYLSCLDACPTAPSGGPDPACAKACPRGTSTAGTSAEAQIDDCRNTGAGAKCASCGIDGGGENPIVHQTCVPTTDTTPCYTCEDSSCCKTQAACAANPDCHAYKVCLEDCYVGAADDAGAPAGGAPDGGFCEAICAAVHPSGLADFAPLDTCVLALCAVKCEDPPMPPLPACEACTYQFCADEFANATGTADGYLYGACFAVCPSGDNPCTRACNTAYPDGQAASMALVGCLDNNCPSCF